MFPSPPKKRRWHSPPKKSPGKVTKLSPSKRSLQKSTIPCPTKRMSPSKATRRSPETKDTKKRMYRFPLFSLVWSVYGTTLCSEHAESEAIWPKEFKVICSAAFFSTGKLIDSIKSKDYDYVKTFAHGRGKLKDIRVESNSQWNSCCICNVLDVLFSESGVHLLAGLFLCETWDL